MKKVFIVGLVVSFIFCFTSCSKYVSTDSFDAISVYMGKEDVLKKMGEGGVARGSMINKFGQVIEVREYQVDRGKPAAEWVEESIITALTLGLCFPILFTEGEIETYWFFFYDGQLVQWGKAEDWAVTERRIYDVNFNISHKSK